MGVLIHHGSKVHQEFYCRHCPADDPASPDPQRRKTGGHFRVRFNVGYDAKLKVHCPKCKHVHSRVVLNGEIREFGAIGKDVIEDDIKVPLAAWSRDPMTRVGADVKAAAKGPDDNFHSEIRGGLVIKTEADLSEAAKQVGRTRPILELYNPDDDAEGDGAGAK